MTWKVQSQQRTAEHVVDEPDGAGESVQQRTVEQVIDVPDDAGGAQQRTVEQIVSVATETTEEATTTLNRAGLDVTQRVIRAKAAPKILAECSLSEAVPLELDRVRYEQQAQRLFKRDAAVDEASAGRSEPERSVRLAEAAQGLSRDVGQGAGRSTHDESMFHMAERIPKGTKRKREVSVEKVHSRRGTDNRLGTASRGSNRDVAISDDHELRHDDDRVDKWQVELEHHPANQAFLGRENVRTRKATERAIHDHRDRPVERVYARGHQSVS